MSPYWQAQMAPLNNGVGNLSAGLMRLPMIRAQGQMMGARAGLYQEEAAKNAADVGLVGAQTDHEKQLTGNLAQIMALTDTIRQAGPRARAAMLAGNQNDPAIDDLTGAVAALTGANKGDVWKSMQGSIATPRAAAGDVQGAANVANPVSVANNANDNLEKAGRPMIVPSGGTLYTPAGQPLGTGGFTLNSGQTRFAPQGNLSAGLTQDPNDFDPVDQGAATPAPAAMTPVASGLPLPAKSTGTKADTERNRLMADYILKQNGGMPLGAQAPTNSLSNILAMYDQNQGGTNQPSAATTAAPAAPAANADPEVALAMQAIAQGANPANVAAKFKARTGKPFPTNGQ